MIMSAMVRIFSWGERWKCSIQLSSASLNGTFSSFTSWQYSFHCTNKKPKLGFHYITSIGNLILQLWFSSTRVLIDILSSITMVCEFLYKITLKTLIITKKMCKTARTSNDVDHDVEILFRPYLKKFGTLWIGLVFVSFVNVVNYVNEVSYHWKVHVYIPFQDIPLITIDFFRAKIWPCEYGWIKNQMCRNLNVSALTISLFKKLTTVFN